MNTYFFKNKNETLIHMLFWNFSFYIHINSYICVYIWQLSFHTSKYRSVLINNYGVAEDQAQLEKLKYSNSVTVTFMIKKILSLTTSLHTLQFGFPVSIWGLASIKCSQVPPPLHLKSQYLWRTSTAPGFGGSLRAWGVWVEGDHLFFLIAASAVTGSGLGSDILPKLKPLKAGPSSSMWVIIEHAHREFLKFLF
jgi:hypothetical protein